MKEVRALLLAAGLGTRLRPLTHSCPKCLIPIGGRPLLEHWLCALYRNGITQALVNIHHHRTLVESFLARNQFQGWVYGVHEPQPEPHGVVRVYESTDCLERDIQFPALCVSAD